MTNHTHYPLVSIGIPTYNRADGYLKQALESAIKQKYPNLEIIVSDNCSTDNTEKVVKSFNDARIRYFKQEVNIGAINNSNFCLDQAEGSYFLQLQDDDLIDYDFIETCMKAADYSTGIGIIQSGTRVIDDKGIVLSEYPNRSKGFSTEDYYRNWFTCKTSWYLCSSLFNTKGLKEIGGFISKHNLFDDAAAMVQLAAKLGRVDIEEIKASFRLHAAEQTFGANTRDWCEDSLYLLDLMCDSVFEQQKASIRKEGIRFLSSINYGFAKKIPPFAKRYNAYLTVFRSFNYKHFPPPIEKLLYRNPICNGLRFTKRKVISFLTST